jgi:ComF family protein
VERCRECAGRRLAFASARAAVRYAGPAKALVRAWKESGLRPLDRVAAELVAERIARPAAADVITYIPPDRDRSVRRGHHPAAGLAGELGRAWELEAAALLRRTRTVGRQTGLPLAERRQNVAGAFAAARPVRGTVVLVDDVYTTGATVASAATALRAGGARAVHVVTLARAVR